MNYELTNRNPYDFALLPHNGIAIMIKQEWSDDFIKIIDENKVSHLFLNHTYGWECESYDFIKNLPDFQGLDIIDVHDTGIEVVSCQSKLLDISLNMPIKSLVELDGFRLLRKCYVPWSKFVASILDVNSLQELYINNFKTKDKHNLSNLTNLKKLTIANSDITNISFLANMRGLNTLELLNCKKICSFNPIKDVCGLKRLRIDGFNDIGDLSFLDESKSLEVLLLNVGKTNSISSLQMLTKLKAVAFFGAKTNILDGNLYPLTHLEQLSMLMLVNRKHYSHKVIKQWNWDDFNYPSVLLEKI